MAVPKLNAPTYELELPSTGEKIKYRPFLVKEQKNLMLAVESEEDSQIKMLSQNLFPLVLLKRLNPSKYLCLILNICFLDLEANL